MKTDDNIRVPVNRAEQNRKNKISLSLNRFVDWLDHFGESSQDQYDFWATGYGQWAKSLYYRIPWIGTIAVAPFVFLDAFLPASRRWFWPRTRFPIADAHFAMGFANLYRGTGEDRFYHKALHFLNELKNSRCPAYRDLCWGYPFDWVGNSGMVKKLTPLITTTPYVYESFAAIYEIDSDNKWLEIMRSVAEHVANDYLDEEIRENVCVCSYTAMDPVSQEKIHYVVNANAYRAFMLTDAAFRFAKDEYWKIAQCNLNFVLESQQPDGSWFYATDGRDTFIDHFHTCFVLKNLTKIERLTGHKRCRDAIKRGMEFYIAHLLDKDGLPKPFAKAPRVTLYRRELYDYAESINLAILQMKNHGEFERILNAQLSDLLSRWQKPDGSFRTRQLFLGWNNVPYHRWGQAQLFRSLSLSLLQENNPKL